LVNIPADEPPPERGEETGGQSSEADSRASVRRADLRSPVRRIATDPAVDAPSPGIGLCLSGGGYRAMLFHLGSLSRLNEAGYLPRLDRISSVSGGSIVAGMLGARWSSLRFESGVAINFDEQVVEPLRTVAARTLDVPSVLLGLLIPGTTINARLASGYRRALFKNATLQDLPTRPEFVINATSLQTGDLWRFARTSQGDWRVGEMGSPTTDLAVAVAASSAFPPVLSPSVLPVNEGQMRPGHDPSVACAPYTTRVVLADGGVYDNLGLEAVWRKYDTVLVSDGGGHMADMPRPGRTWISQFMRVLHTIDNQVRDLRKSQAVTSFEDGQRHGAYWGIRSHVRDFGLADPIMDPPDSAVTSLAAIATRLAKVQPTSQERLINWGYLICDTALRRWVDPSQPRGSLPHPRAELGGPSVAG
jgi:NTE family protein